MHCRLKFGTTKSIRTLCNDLDLAGQAFGTSIFDWTNYLPVPSILRLPPMLTPWLGLTDHTFLASALDDR